MKKERGSPHWGEDALDRPPVKLAKEFGKKEQSSGLGGVGWGFGPGARDPVSQEESRNTFLQLLGGVCKFSYPHRCSGPLFIWTELCCPGTSP